jgi:hydroxymethylbilane synthase
MRRLRLATRNSPLALWQARWVAQRLRRAHPGLAVELVPMTAGGDRDLATPLYALGVVGVFVKEVQAAVLAGAADAGVHSCKDLPTGEPDGLVLAAILPRADPRDCLVGAGSLAGLPPQATIGTSSLRRQAQLAAVRPDLRFVPLRGNVHTRLRRIAEGAAQATVMAAAGLRRLGLAGAVRAVPLDPIAVCTPAPAQGAIAVDCRRDDRRTRWLLAALDHRPTACAIGLERAVLAGLAGGCSLPLGCLAWRDRAGAWRLHARLGHAGGIIETTVGGSLGDLAERALRALDAGRRTQDAGR